MPDRDPQERCAPASPIDAGCEEGTYWIGIGGRVFSVICPCGFRVNGLSTSEAAEDTCRWHKGLPSQMGSVAGPWKP
jgi:hypothetical protein